MSDALSKFIGNLQSLDPQAAFANFKGLDAGTQGQVLTDLTSKYGTTFDELNGLSEADKRRVTQNIKDGKSTFDGVSRQPAQADAKTFEQKWTQSQEAQRNNDAAYHPTQDKAFASRYGVTEASNRYGYQPPHRQAQIERIASIQAEAKATNKTFSEVADARVANGK
jgi:hypothetical protein